MIDKASRCINLGTRLECFKGISSHAFQLINEFTSAPAQPKIA